MDPADQSPDSDKINWIQNERWHPYSSLSGVDTDPFCNAGFLRYVRVHAVDRPDIQYGDSSTSLLPPSQFSNWSSTRPML